MIFLFHAQEDEEQAEHIRKELSVAGEVKIWEENNNLASPPERSAAIANDLKNSRFKVIVFSKHAFERRRSEQLLREFDELVNSFKGQPELAKTFFPIRVDNCVMPILEEHFPYYTLFEEGGLEQVVRVIQRLSEEPDTKEALEGEFLFYRNSWKWILQFQDSSTIGDHRCHTGFAYLHFILNSGLHTLSIGRLKKVVTKLHQPERNDLLGLEEDEEEENFKIIPDPPRSKKKEEEVSPKDLKLFRQIRDEIIYAIQSLPAGKLQDFFMNALKFGGDRYVIYNSFWDGKKVRWTLYRRK